VRVLEHSLPLAGPTERRQASAAEPAFGKPVTVACPSLRVVLRHLGLSLLWANLVPAALFYACFRAGNIWAALIAALVWCYGAMAWRLTTRRRTSGLLWLTAVGLTAKTAVTMITGNTVLYFAQPAINDGLVAALFLLSLATARPVVARLAGDFFPMDDDVASRPRIQQLFWRLTLLWAGICAIKALATVWLLESVRLSTFVAIKSVLTPSIAMVGVAVTVAIALRVARHEGLLHAAA
jgi:intracellular septation protein A